MIPPPAIDKPIYDEQIRGVFGTFGAGMGIRVCFLQAAIEATDLKKIELVSEIPGSDRWPVRDLFQREVDTRRVETSILPWLQDDTKVKFFNPLTLTLVPIEPGTNRIVAEVPSLIKNKEADEFGTWITLEREGMYRFRYLAGRNGSHHREYGMVEWNSRTVRLVAIDGQHRLSALKRYLDDQTSKGFSEFVEWNVPVVISGLDRDRPVNATILDLVRNMFVYINTQARTPSKSRQILLNDEDIVCLCVQELLQYSHENDSIEDARDRVQSRLPLLFFDWRGTTENGREIPAPAALKTVSEIAKWLSHYFFNNNSNNSIVNALGIDRSSDLFRGIEANAITPDRAADVRKQFREQFLPGIVHLLEEFAPYKKYISSVRSAESNWSMKSDVYRHSLALLRFGSHRGGDSIQSDVNSAYHEVLHELIDMKQEIPTLLGLDIGMRGVISAYSQLKEFIDDLDLVSVDGWHDYSKWFTKHLNAAYGNGWFGKETTELRRYVTHSATDSVINFKISDARKSFGSLVSLVVGYSAYQAKDLFDDDILISKVWKQFGQTQLFSTLRSGHEKQKRSEIRTSNPEWSASRVREEAKKLANKAAHAQLDRIRRKLES